jgi:hypothetical protein
MPAWTDVGTVILAACVPSSTPIAYALAVRKADRESGLSVRGILAEPDEGAHRERDKVHGGWQIRRGGLGLPQCGHVRRADVGAGHRRDQRVGRCRYTARLEDERSAASDQSRASDDRAAKSRTIVSRNASGRCEGTTDGCFDVRRVREQLVKPWRLGRDPRSLMRLRPGAKDVDRPSLCAHATRSSAACRRRPALFIGTASR